MSKLNRKDFKASLNRWKSFLLNEHKIISRDEIIEIMIREGRPHEVKYFTVFWNNNRFITKYTQVIQNELISYTEEPIKEILDICKLHYEKIYQSAGPTLKDQIGSGSTSIDELRKQIDSKSSFNKNEVRQQCRYQSGRPVVGNYQDFDIVYSESDWIVIEPKTTIGSIAWTHGKPDGSEETDQERRSGWCTGVSTGNNMFPNYAGNLHMFYIVNTDYDNDKSANRRLCLSYTASEGEAILEEKGGSTVDAINQSINAELINKIVDKSILELIENRVSSRKETSFAEIYSKITVSQLKRQIAQMKSQGIDSDVIEGELNNYVKYTKSKDVVDYILSISDQEYVKRTIAYRKDLLELDPEGELVRQLANDKDKLVRGYIAGRKNLLEADPSGELVRQLANDENKNVRRFIASRKDLLEADPSGELVRQLANDENKNVRSSIASRKDLLEADPSGELVRQLANNEDVYVRWTIASRKDLLEADPSGKLITQLANDEDRNVRANIADRKEYIEFLNKKTNEVVLKNYIKIILS